MEIMEFDFILILIDEFEVMLENEIIVLND